MLRSLDKSIATIAFMAALSSTAPVLAADTNATTMTAPAAAATAAPTQNSAKHTSHKMTINARISSLHDKLQITAAQEETWKAVADVMKENETSIHKLIWDRHSKVKTLSAVEDLESYEKIASAHAEGLKKLIPAFKTLYDTMSDDQKKNADTVFGSFEGHPDRKAEMAK